MLNDHKMRWVFGPLEDGQHVASEYSIACEYPHILDGHALALCRMNAHQLAAARKDPRLTVLPSLHEHAQVPDHVADHHAHHGVQRGMKLHEMLLTLAKVHPNFEPEV